MSDTPGTDLPDDGRGAAAQPLSAAEARDRLEKLAAHVPGVIYHYQQWPDGRTAFPYASAGMRDIYGVDPEEVREDATRVFEAVDERDYAHVEASIAHSAETLETWNEIYRVNLPERGTIWVEGEASPERLADGSTLWHGYIHNVSERLRREEEREALEAQVKLAAEVFSSSSEGIIVCDRDNRILQVNDGFERITGYSRDDAIGRTPNFLASGRHDVDFYQRMWESVQETGSWRGEIWNRRASGKVYAELLSISVIRDERGEVRNYIGVFSDIAPVKEHERELQRIANYDHLTGIPNRRLLTDRLEVAMQRARRDGSVLAVCYLDLDGFKAINDRFGHDVGDVILVKITGRLKDAMRGEETLARLGGDEFVLLFNDVKNRRNLERLLNRLLSLIREPVVDAGESHVLSASIGVTLSPPDERDPEALIRHADQAMYRAKQAGRDCIVFYDQALDTELQVRLERRTQVAEALKAGELFLEYQPQIDLQSGLAVGVEVLLRWRHPEQGVLGPVHFLADIDGSALEIDIGEWVMDAALAQLESWKRSGLALTLSVNISEQQLLSSGFTKLLRSVLQAHPLISPDEVTLEILESATLQDRKTARATVDFCRSMGLRVALDYFGTGYSSLGHLRELSVDFLKIDGSVVEGMLKKDADLKTVESVIGLAHAFHLEVVAEGITSGAHAGRLLELGCRYGQGQAMAPPMAAEDIPAWMAAQRPPVRATR